MVYGIQAFNENLGSGGGANRTVLSTDDSVSTFSMSAPQNVSAQALRDRWYPAFPASAGTANAGGFRNGQSEGSLDKYNLDHPDGPIFVARPHWRNASYSSQLTTTSVGSGLVVSRMNHWDVEQGLWLQNTNTAIQNYGDSSTFVFNAVSPLGSNAVSLEAGIGPALATSTDGDGYVISKILESKSPHSGARTTTGGHGIEVKNGSSEIVYNTRGRTPIVIATGLVAYGKEFVYEVPSYYNYKKIYCLAANTRSIVLRFFTNSSYNSEKFKVVFRQQYIFYPPSSSSNAKVGIINDYFVRDAPYPSSSAVGGAKYTAITQEPLFYALFYNPYDDLLTGE